MCIIAVKKRGAPLPPNRHLINSAMNHPDGMGIAYWKRGSDDVIIKKNFKNVNWLIRFIRKNIKKEDALIIHFRFATAGLVDMGNRHPFPVTKNKRLLRKVELVCKLAVAHNGVLTQYDDDKRLSDSQKFVLDIISDNAIKNNLENKTIRKLIENFILNDRLVFLNNKGKFTFFGEWVKYKKILYSNSSFTYGYGRVNTRVTVSKKQEKDDDKKCLYRDCEGCGKQTWVQNTYVGSVEKTAFLCLKCRYFLKKNKTIEIKEKKEPLIKCLSCDMYYEKEHMMQYNGGPVCNNCIIEIQKNYHYGD
jgi:predicted glutamine amidotransferase